MNPRMLLSAVTGGLVVAPLPSEAQQTKRVYTIGFLTQAACPAPPHIEEPFRQMLRDLGYVEGQDIVIDCGAAGQTDRLPRQTGLDRRT